MNLPELQGSPKQVSWAARIRHERLMVWQNSSPELFTSIEQSLAVMTDAGWWISYKDKDITTVCNHFLHGVDLQKIQRDQWRMKEKKQEQKESSEVRSYLKKELQKELQKETVRKGITKLDATVIQSVSGKDGLMRFASQSIDRKTGEVSRDPDVPF